MIARRSPRLRACVSGHNRLVSAGMTISPMEEKIMPDTKANDVMQTINRMLASSRGPPRLSISPIRCWPRSGSFEPPIGCEGEGGDGCDGVVTWKGARPSRPSIRYPISIGGQNPESETFDLPMQNLKLRISNQSPPLIKVIL